MSSSRKKHWLILALLMTTCSGNAEPAGAQPKPPDNKSGTPPDVERLIRRLGSDSFADREEAMKELRRLGKPALEALRTAAANSCDKQVRRRAAELLDKLLESAYVKQLEEADQLLEEEGS